LRIFLFALHALFLCAHGALLSSFFMRRFPASLAQKNYLLISHVQGAGRGKFFETRIALGKKTFGFQ